MVEVFEPVSEVLKKYVGSIYIFERSEGEIKYTSYPSTATAVGLFRNTAINNDDEGVVIKSADTPCFMAVANNRLFKPVTLRYHQMVDEIAINFHPLGFATFAKGPITIHDFFAFNSWDDYLEDLFEAVFTAPTPADKLNTIENFLLQRYNQLADEKMLMKTIELLSDPDRDHKINEIAETLHVHPKYLYRSFIRHVGCSLAHYKKIVKFRRSLHAKMIKGDTASFTEICYENDFTDQSYFIKQYHELTGETPKRLFNDISSFGNNRVIFRFH